RRRADEGGRRGLQALHQGAGGCRQRLERQPAPGFLQGLERAPRQAPRLRLAQVTPRARWSDTDLMAERVLMIDDDNRLAGMVSDYLGGAGLSVALTPTAPRGRGVLKRGDLDPADLRPHLTRAARPA